MHHRVRRIDIGDRDIRPPGQLHAVFPGEIEQVASIMLVRSVETRSAQSKVSLRGNASSTSAVRLRISGSKLARLDGATIGATVRRCAVWPGGSIRMKLVQLLPFRLVGHLNAAELRTRRIGLVIEFDRKDVVVARHRPIRPERRGLAIMHGIVAAQLLEQRPPGVVLIKLGIADVDRRQLALQRLGHRLPPLCRRRLTGDLDPDDRGRCGRE